MYIILFLIIAGLFGFIIYMMVSNRKKEADENIPEPNIKTETVTAESIVQDEIMDHLNALVKLNFAIRNDPLRNEDIVKELEDIVNSLVDILPVVNEESSDISLIHVINNIGDDYLPRLLNPYIKLNESERKQKTAKILDGLKEISTKLSSTADKINKGEFDKIEMEVSFLKSRCQ